MEAAGLLSGSRLSKSQLQELTPLLRLAGPLELPLLLQPFFLTKDPEVGRILAENLPGSPATGSMDIGELKRLVGLFPAEAIGKLPEWIAGLEAQSGQRAGKLEELAPSLGNGDTEKGRRLFLEGKGACVICHRIGEHGREVGPNLSAIGGIRTSRDLLESILLPCESLARDFETFQVRSKGGTIRRGLIRKETRDAIHLIDSTGKENAIPWSEVETVEALPVSFMPRGLDQTLSEAELIDLIAFLKSRKPDE
jgi:putative heme-binding domain-containing protein